MTKAEEAATEHYKLRSGAFATLLAEGFPDPEDGDLNPREREMAEQAHAILGRAIEAEVFGDRRKPRAGSPADDVQDPDTEC